MKLLRKMAVLLLLTMAVHAKAQNLAGFEIEAHYPLTTSATDSTQVYANATTTNAPFANGSIFSNGKYIGNDTTGSLIQTPQISGFTDAGFALQVSFAAEEKGKPILICGSSWRWLTIGTTSQGYLQVRATQNTGFDRLLTSTDTISLKQWHTATVLYDSSTLYLNVYLDGNKVAEDTLAGHFVHNQNFNFSNTHAGYGHTFHGYLRHLKVYNKNAQFSVDEHAAKNAFSLYPNPATEKLTITKPATGASKIEVFNLHGKHVATVQLDERKKTISVANWPAGVYLFSYVANGQLQTEQICIR